jgi:hypothetical protein
MAATFRTGGTKGTTIAGVDAHQARAASTTTGSMPPPPDLTAAIRRARGMAPPVAPELRPVSPASRGASSFVATFPCETDLTARILAARRAQGAR